MTDEGLSCKSRGDWGCQVEQHEDVVAALRAELLQVKRDHMSDVRLLTVERDAALKLVDDTVEALTAVEEGRTS